MIDRPGHFIAIGACLTRRPQGAGIVDQHVELLETGDKGIGKRVDLGKGRQIERQPGHGITGFRGDTRRRLFGPAELRLVRITLAPALLNARAPA